MVVDHETLAVARARLLAEANAVSALCDSIGDDFVRVAGVIRYCRGKLFVGGSGTSGTVARRMAHILSVTGTPTVPFSPMDSLHGASGAITSDDVVLLISNGGSSDEVLQVAEICRNRGATVIALTRDDDTPLARLAHHSATVRVEGQADIGGVIATGVTLAQAAWGDALAEVLMRARGYTWREFMTTHPAGAVGQLDQLPPDLAPLTLPVPRGASVLAARSGGDR